MRSNMGIHFHNTFKNLMCLKVDSHFIFPLESKISFAISQLLRNHYIEENREKEYIKSNWEVFFIYGGREGI